MLPNFLAFLEPHPECDRINALLAQKPEDVTEDDWLYDAESDRPRWQTEEEEADGEN